VAVTLDLDDIQGLIARGYGKLPAAFFLLLRIGDPAAARRWLAVLADRVTPGRASPDDAATHVAFTHAGLASLGLDQDALAAFPPEFAVGMTNRHRRRLLGDLGGNAPEHWSWGGPATPPVHLVLLLYAKDDQTLEAARARYQAELADAGLVPVWELPTTPLGEREPDGRERSSREHFGFHDGISQPLVEGLAKVGPPANTIKAGEIVLGYENGYDRYTERPLLATNADPDRLLPRDPEGSGAPDLGRNGSYLVIRQLRQDVPRFWRFLDGATTRPDGSSDPPARLRLAAKMVGRWPSGTPLVMAPQQDDPALAEANHFRYAADGDADGDRCPLGAHVRRTNTRDSLDPDPGSQRSVDVANRHRILRRGRTYGEPLTPDDALAQVPPPHAGQDRGLHFMCLNANIARQFEFVQHTWANSAKFNGLYDDPDPIATASAELGSTFTVQASPVRQRVTGVPPFITVLGGAYFFLPGIRAIRYLATLGRA
jgi:Dyp-type peroxidase family